MKRLCLVLSLLLVATGCAPSGERFHGVYSTTGTLTVSLQGYGSELSPLSGSWLISEGDGSDLVFSDPAGQCLLPADVVGDQVVSFRPGAGCTLSLDGSPLTLSVSNGTATLAGKAIQFNLSGNLTATRQGRVYPGSFLQHATLTRVGR